MDLILRATVVFVLIWIITRVAGRRELSTMQPIDLILLIVVGDMVQQGVTQGDTSVTGAMLVIFTFTLLTVGASYLSFRVPGLRPAMDGEPLVLVHDGEVIERNLRRERITPEDLAAEARLQQIGDLADVRLAVLETSGRISFVER
ncbi:MAG: DUF421 domain-containing protein [Solirubrobacteraceae bacterium]|nr:DUF421 domain-containing protein [Solirubrobacteraceae bacterium]